MDEPVRLLLASGVESSDGGHRHCSEPSFAHTSRGVPSSSSSFVSASLAVLFTILRAMRDDVDYSPMASPNALIHSEKRFRLLVQIYLMLRSRVVFTLESDLRSPLRARRASPRLVRPEQEHKLV